MDFDFALVDLARDLAVWMVLIADIDGALFKKFDDA